MIADTNHYLLPTAAVWHSISNTLYNNEAKFLIQINWTYIAHTHPVHSAS